MLMQKPTEPENVFIVEGDGRELTKAEAERVMRRNAIVYKIVLGAVLAMLVIASQVKN